MEFRYRGIVLKSFTPVRRSAIILNKEEGKFLGSVTHNKHLIHGSVVEYRLCTRARYSLLEDVEVVELPEHHARQDILFFHHILELCNHFIPIGYKEEAVFDFLHELCSDEQLVFSGPICRRFLLFKLCALLGIYPEDAYFHTNFFYRLARLSIHEMIKKKIVDTEIIDRLDSWINECVALHPLMKNFQTVHFLTGGRKP